MQRIMTERERELAERRRPKLAEFVAGRFAAKEAVAKAIGCGVGGTVGFQDMEVLPDPSGRPVCCLSDEAMQRLGWTDAAKVIIHLSITHTESFASAFAVIERT